jgi:hypothetical protein
MIRVTLTPEQAEAIVTSGQEVELVDPDGNRIGTVAPPFTAEEIAEALAAGRCNDERRTTAQVLERIRSLESS